MATSVHARVANGRELWSIELPATASSIGDLKRQLFVTRGIPAAEVNLIAKGKALSDDAQVPDVKMMLLRKQAPTQQTRRVSLRCLLTGRVARDVEISPKARIAELLQVASKALGLNDEPRALFCEKKRMLLRADLSLTDYDIADRAELFVCPAPPPSGAAATNKSKALPTEMLKESLGGSLEDAMAAALKEPTAGMLNGLSARMLSDLGACGASIDMASCQSVAQLHDEMTAALAGRGSATQLAVQLGLAAPDGSSTEATAHHASTEGGPPTTAALPVQLRSGLVGSGPDLQRPMAAVLKQMMKPGGEVDQMMLPGGELAGALAAAMEEAETQNVSRLEEKLGDMVSQLERSDASTAKAAATTASQRAVEQKAFGKGLAKGFLTRPRRKRKAAAPPAEPRAAAADAKATVGGAEENAVTRQPHAKAGAACCFTCSARLPVTACLQSRCRCGQLFCPAHMHAHCCDFDYKAANSRRLQEVLPKIVPKIVPEQI